MSSSTGLPDRPISAEEFLRNVLRSGLLDRDDLQSSLRGVPRDQRDDAPALAEYLVRNGRLTRFQASKLLRGISQGMIIGPFRVLAPLGQGGMGKVFLVRDTRNDQLIALKILPPRLARTEERMMARFRREMQMSQRVAHPNLAWTYEVGEVRGVPYIAMEYIPGKTLSRLVIDEGPLKHSRAARLLAEVASGLEHAHNQGLVHRDLKPSNILITPRDHAKVLDLGLALIHGEQVSDTTVVGGQGYIVGTMDYIAPEQTLDASRVDRRSDIYSLGCTLYYAISGQTPFPGGTGKEKIQRHRRAEPTPLAQLAPGTPPGFIAYIERMMDKKPENRPQTSREVEITLRGWSTTEADQPFDRLEEVLFDESMIIQQGPGSTEYSKVSLPEMETIDEPMARSDESSEDLALGEPTSSGGTFQLVVLGLSAGLLLFVCVIVAWLYLLGK
jgi:serine/threonine protein kinase